jgi:peptide/nickel transport system permease protein
MEGAAEDWRAMDANEDRIYVASQWRLMWLHFKRHRLALAGGVVVLLLYLLALFAGFLAPYGKYQRFPGFIHVPPQKIHFHDGDRLHLRPFVYGLIPRPDPETFTRVYEVDKSKKYFVRFFVRGHEYELFGLIPTDRHLFGVDEGGMILLLGTDELGRDLLSRIFAGATISLSIGLVGVFTSFTLGAILGGISGYYGGVIDIVLQRVIELITSIPTIPLWMALSAAVPRGWPPLRVYFAITIILALRGWCRMARVVRGKLLELREYDFVVAARLAGTSDWHIIISHLLPLLMSYLIVNMTLAIPRMIIGETALSFLGLGLRPPIVSWGVLLEQAQHVRVVSQYPWLLTPAVFVIVTVLAFNFMGDGLRDAADPYKL